MLLFAASSAFAHAVAVNLDAYTEKQQLVVLMNGTMGQPINGAVLAFSVLSSSGEIAGGALKMVADGEYRAALPIIQAGTYTLKFRDTTFPQEALEIGRSVDFPLQNAVRLLLPASSAGQPAIAVLVGLATLPVIIAMLVLLVVLFVRPKPKPEAIE